MEAGLPALEKGLRFREGGLFLGEGVGERESLPPKPPCHNVGATAPLDLWKRQLDPTGTAGEDWADRAHPGRLPFPGGTRARVLFCKHKD